MASSNSTRDQLLECLRVDAGYLHTVASLAPLVNRRRETVHETLVRMAAENLIIRGEFKEDRRVVACYGALGTPRDAPIKLVRMVPQLMVRRKSVKMTGGAPEFEEVPVERVGFSAAELSRGNEMASYLKR